MVSSYWMENNLKRTNSTICSFVAELTHIKKLFDAFKPFALATQAAGFREIFSNHHFQKVSQGGKISKLLGGETK